MKNYKKLIFILLALVLVFAFVGCGEKSGDGKDSESANVSDTESIVNSTPEDDKQQAMDEAKENSRVDECREFIASSIKQIIAEQAEDCTWNDNTICVNGKSLYNVDGSEYSGMIFMLETDGVVDGYIQVLFFGDGELILEGYSFTGYPEGIYEADGKIIYLGNGEYAIGTNVDGEYTYKNPTDAEKSYTADELQTKFDELKAKYE